MAEEYRIDIAVGATDNTGPALQSASKRVSQFEKSVAKTEQQLARMQRTRWQLTVHAIDRASSVILAIDRRALSLTRRAWTITLRATDYATRPIRAVANLLTSTLGLLGIAGGTWGAVIQPLRQAGEWEQTQIAFETLLGSAEQAQRFMAEAQAFAKATPFDTAGVLEASRLLLAFGFEAEQVLPMLTTIGDAASGLGKGAEGVERMVMALGQMHAKGRAQMEELLQLQELGVEASKILQEELGLTAEQVGNIGSLGLESDRVIEALLTGMRKRFGGEMERQSNTFLGLLNQIKETFNNQILLRWGVGLQLGLEPHLRRIVDWIEANQDAIDRWGDALENAGLRAADWVAEKFQGVYQWIQEVVASPRWQQADNPFEYLQILFEDWTNRNGEGWIRQKGEQIGGALKTGIRIGFGGAWNILKSVQGTAGGTVLDLWLLSQVAPGLWFTGATVARGVQWGRRSWQWLRGLGKGAAAAAGAVQATAASGAAAAGASSAAAAATSALTSGAAAGAARAIPIYGPNGQIIASVAQSADDVARAAATGSRLLGSLRSLGSTVGRYGGPIGALLGTGIGLLGVVGAPDKGAAIGSAIGSGLGGWGGAAGGAAIGSMIAPGIGTVIGGLLGGLLGGWGGGKVGGWLGDKATPDVVPTVAQSVGPAVFVTIEPGAVQCQYQIEADADAQSILKVIRQNHREICDDLAETLVNELSSVLSNLVVVRRRAPLYATARIAEF